MGFLAVLQPQSNYTFCAINSAVRGVTVLFGLTGRERPLPCESSDTLKLETFHAGNAIHKPADMAQQRKEPEKQLSLSGSDESFELVTTS
jgi:hypothetical protein